jgi:hypothetical protein
MMKALYLFAILFPLLALATSGSVDLGGGIGSGGGGDGITALTGDVTATGPGSAAATLAASIAGTHSLTGNVNVGGASANTGATLDVQGTTGGIGFPNLTDAQRNALTPTRPGVMIWNTDNGRFEKFSGGSWGVLVNGPSLVAGENIAPAKVTVSDGAVLATSGAQPACNAGNRGMMWVIQGGASVADIFQICLKDNADAYAWATK